jgi:ubiquinone biosynthesis protein
MFKRVFRLFQIARRLSTSGAISTINQIQEIPLPINLFFNFISIGSETNRLDEQKKPGEKLCMALQGMGTTFIKLGQFLATRPDIIGEEMAKDLEKLQDKVPAFDLYEAKKIIKKEIGEKQFNNIIEISEPIAAASIAQVHIAKIKNENRERQVAIKILRPDI